MSSSKACICRVCHHDDCVRGDPRLPAEQMTCHTRSTWSSCLRVYCKPIACVREKGSLTIAVGKEMALEFWFLGEWLIWTMAPFPAAVVPIAFCSINGIHMVGHQMILQSTRIRKGCTTDSLNPMNLGHPLANIQVSILSRKVRGRQDRRHTSVQRGWSLSRAWKEMWAHARSWLTRVRRIGMWMDVMVPSASVMVAVWPSGDVKVQVVRVFEVAVDMLMFGMNAIQGVHCRLVIGFLGVTSVRLLL